MSSPQIKWKPVEILAYPNNFVAHEGYDEDGNYYYETANQEIVVCVMKDGRKADGWDAKDALMRAQQVKMLATSNKEND